MDSKDENVRQGRLPGLQYHGYHQRSRQPAIRLTFKLPLGSLVTVGTIDAWLVGPFGMDPASLPAVPDPRHERPAMALATALLERALLLFGELLRASRAPCFECGRVMGVRASADRSQDLEATVLLPVIDNVPVAPLLQLFKNVVGLVLNRPSTSPGESETQALLAEVNRAIVGPLTAKLPFNLSTLATCQLAFAHDIPFRHIGAGLVMLGQGSKATIMRGAGVARDSAIGAQICSQKPVTANMLRYAGLPAAEHLQVNSEGDALAAAERLGWPLVVKPANQERSIGVSVDIRTASALRLAYAHARVDGSPVIIERQVSGHCHRVMVANGKLIYVVIRYPKGVIGNGVDTVAQLAAAANAGQALRPPWKRLKEVPLDETALRCLADQSLELGSIPADGRRVFMRDISSGEWGGSVENLTSRIHPDNVELALAAARQVNLTVAGVDLMSVDIARPWHENGATIIEINYDPEFAIEGREAETAKLLPALIVGDGRIPVHLVTGEGDLLNHARELRLTPSYQAQALHLTTADRTLDPLGREIPMPFATLFERSMALILRPDVAGLMLVGTAAELFARGLAVDKIDSVHVLDKDPERRAKTCAHIHARITIKDTAPA